MILIGTYLIYNRFLINLTYEFQYFFKNVLICSSKVHTLNLIFRTHFYLEQLN